MITCIKIQENLSCDYICNRIQELINKYHKENPNHNNDYIIYIELKTPVDIEPHIPKLEHKVDEGLTT